MLIHCSRCSARVKGEIEKHSAPEYEYDDTNNVIAGSRVTLMKCPACQSSLLGQQILVGWDGENDFGGLLNATWSPAKRVWPDPESGLNPSIPSTVQVSLLEAQICLSGGTYTASVVMSGRALEAIARHFQVPGSGDHMMLGRGLQKLHDSRKIDDRLFEWGSTAGWASKRSGSPSRVGHTT